MISSFSCSLNSNEPFSEFELEALSKAAIKHSECINLVVRREEIQTLALSSDFKFTLKSIDDTFFSWIHILKSAAEQCPTLLEKYLFLSFRISADSLQCAFSIRLPCDAFTIEVFWDIYSSNESED